MGWDVHPERVQAMTSGNSREEMLFGTGGGPLIYLWAVLDGLPRTNDETLGVHMPIVRNRPERCLNNGTQRRVNRRRFSTRARRG